MKKYILILFAVLLSAVVFESCSKDDDELEKSEIVGKWKLTEVKTKSSGSYIGWPYKTTYATFYSDKTYYGSGYFGTGSGTWSKSGNTVHTYVDGKLYITYDIISVSSTSAEMKMTMGSSSIWIKCKKQ